MLRKLGLLALIALAGPGAGGASGRAGAGFHVVSIDPRGFRVGDLVWRWQGHNRSVTLADFIGVFGRPSSCRERVRFDAKVEWNRLALRGFFTTLGGTPRPGDTGCSAPSLVHPDTVDVFRHDWRTDRGLRVGDTLTRLRALYPRGSRHGARWWLVVRKRDPLFGTYGQLVAQVQDGKVSYLRLVLHAQGD